MTFTCDEERSKAVYILGHYWRSVEQFHVCQGTSCLVETFLSCSSFPRSRSSVCGRHLQALRHWGCNVALDSLHHLEKLLLSAVPFPAVSRARFPCLSCNGYLFSELSVSYMTVQVCTRCCHPLCDLVSGASLTEGWKAELCTCRVRCLSKCEYPVLVLLEKQQFPCPSLGTSLLVRCRVILHFPLPFSRLKTFYNVVLLDALFQPFFLQSASIFLKLLQLNPFQIRVFKQQKRRGDVIPAAFHMAIQSSVGSNESWLVFRF